MLETKRLILRKLTVEDAEALYRVYHEPEVLTYFTKGPPDSVAVARADIERHLKYYEQHGFGLWATILRDSGELIGRCGLLSQQVDNVAEVEIGYLISPRFWGRGLASEAARAIRDFGFDVVGRSHLISIIHPQNLASKRVATAVGMNFSKTTRFHDVDVEIFSISRAAIQR
jgi:ribosomal-protein-alanine N-acetyltransferase